MFKSFPIILEELRVSLNIKKNFPEDEVCSAQPRITWTSI